MRPSHSILGLAVGLGLLGALSCTTGGEPPSPTPANSEAREALVQARASVDIFSGREPPSWALSAEASRALRQSLQALPKGSRPIPDVGLGYRGFMVAWADGAQARVYRDVVEYTEAGRTVLLEDSGRKVEQGLLDGARPHLAPELFTTVESQVQSAKP